MTIPTLHAPLKDSPTTFLTAGINDTETVLQVADASAFEAAGITRLTLGIDEDKTETVEVVEYSEDLYGALTNEIVVIRGADPLSWPSDTTISRVFTAEDLEEVHEFLEDHDHASGYGTQIPTEGLENQSVTGAKIANETITPVQILNRTRKIFLPATFPYVSISATLPDPDWPIATTPDFGIKLPHDQQTLVGTNGIIPVDYVSDGVLTPVVQTFLGGTPGLQAYFRYEVNIGGIGERVDAKTLTEYDYEGAVDVAPFSLSVYNFINMPSLALPSSGLESGDILSIYFRREGAHASDTFQAWLMLRGFILTYTANS